jgi:pre-60S factor REI1
VSEDLFNQKLAVLQKQKQLGAIENTVQNCSLCGQSFRTVSAYKRHLDSKKHQKRSNKKQEHTERRSSVTSESSTLTSDTDTSLFSHHEPIETFSLTQPDSGKGGDTKSTDSLTGDSTPKVTDLPKRLAPIVEAEPKPLPLRSCLFCPLISSSQTEVKEVPQADTTTATPETHKSKSQFRTIKNCLNHMLKEHGFFIPFVEYLTDLEGFLNYLGAKIGVGHVCLWCGKQKESVAAVQQHMIAKTHCKIRLDTEEDEEEYYDFYTFPNDGTEEEEDTKEIPLPEPSKPKKVEKVTLDFEKLPLQQELQTLLRITTHEILANSGVIPTHLQHVAQQEKEKKEKKSAEETQLVLRESNGTLVSYQPSLRLPQTINDAGELVLTDGSTIGHRSLWRYYRQHVRPTETRESVVLSTLAQKYQTLQLQNYQKSKRMNHVRPAWATARQNKEWMKLGVGAGTLGSKMRYRERNAIII